MPRAFEELRIRYWNLGGDRYFVLANGFDCAGAVISVPDAGRYCSDLNALLREQFRLSPAADSPVSARLATLGEAIGNTFFPAPIAECFEKCKSAAAGSGLRLRFELPPTLASAPIELSRVSGNFLALNRGFSIVRSQKDRRVSPARPPAYGQGPFTVVIAFASPRDYDALDIDVELREIEREVAFESATRLVELQPVPHATRQKLADKINGVNGPCGIILYCHGEFDEKAGVGAVVLEDDNGDADSVSESTLGGLLSGAPNARFVVLSLCKGARTNPYDPWSGVAGQLLASGFPAVVAFQYQVSDASARRFSRAFLHGIVSHQRIDEACAVARMMGGETRETTIEWCTPMLHLRPDCSDTVVIPVHQDAEQEPPHHTCEHALWVVRDSRLCNSWDRTMALAAGRRTTCSGLEPLYREAWIEATLIEPLDHIAEQMAQGSLAGLPAFSSPLLPEVHPVFEPLLNAVEEDKRKRISEKLQAWYRSADEAEKAGDYAVASRLWQQIVAVDRAFSDAEPRYEAELDVFIECAKIDAEAVRPIVEQLGNAGYKVWFDPERDSAAAPQPQHDFNRSRRVLVCLSDAYLALGAPAVELHKVVAAILQQPLTRPAPPGLRAVPWIDLGGGIDSRRFADLVSRLRSKAPFASPADIQVLTRIEGPDRLLAAMRRHSFDVYTFLHEKKVGGKAPRKIEVLAEALTQSGNLPPEILAHVETIQRYALIDTKVLRQASMEPALQALYRLIDWTSNAYAVHTSGQSSDPTERVWHSLANGWIRDARLPSSSWELAEGWRQVVTPWFMYKARNLDDQSRADLLLLPSSKAFAQEIEHCRSMEHSAALSILDAGSFADEEWREWQFAIMARPQGCALQDILAHLAPLPENVGIALVRQISLAFGNIQSKSPELARILFRLDHIVIDQAGSVRLAWNWNAPDQSAELSRGWSDLRNALCERMEDSLPVAWRTLLALSQHPREVGARPEAGGAPGSDDHLLLQTMVKCLSENSPLPEWITSPPSPAPAPSLPAAGCRLVFKLAIDCEHAWPLDEDHVIIQSSEGLSLLRSDGHVEWHEPRPVLVRRAVCANGVAALGGWGGELYWFGGGAWQGSDNTRSTIGDIREFNGGWLAGAWNKRLQFLSQTGNSTMVDPQPSDGVCRLEVAKDGRWSMLSMGGTVSTYDGTGRRGQPQHIQGAIALGFAGSQAVVLTTEGLVVLEPGISAPKPDRLPPSRGSLSLRLLFSAQEEACLLVDEDGRSWIVDRAGTYPRGPHLPAGRRVAFAAAFRRAIAPLADIGFAYFRHEFKIKSWPHALSAEISTDGTRIAVVSPGSVELYEDPL